MTKESTAISIRLPDDAHGALTAYADTTGITLSEAALQAIYEFLADKGSTSRAVAERMNAETKLSKLVLARAHEIKPQDWSNDVTMQMFDWLSEHHSSVYTRAVGPNSEHAYRINPQLAKRFAFAIEADYVRDENGKATKTYLARNANKLIQSYTNLKKP